MFKKSLTLLIFLLISIPAAASVIYWPGYEFKTIHTEHFRIHYHQGLRDLAYRAAVIGEQTLPILTEYFHYEPKGKIEIVLSDDQDKSNGSSSALPVNTERLYMAVPHPSMQLDDYDDWLRMLMIHELTHTVHIDMVRGFPKFLRYIFGRVITFNHFNPVFAVEGLAVFNETRLTTGGRANSAYGEMLLRGEWMGGALPTIDKISNWTQKWPAGARPYIFGGMFHQYVASLYGEQVWGEIASRHSGAIWPFMYNRDMKKVTSMRLTELYGSWMTYLDQKYRNLFATIEADGLTESEPLTKMGGQNRRPVFSKDGQYLFFEENNGKRDGRIRRVDLSRRKVKTWKVTGETGDATLLPDGRIIVSAAGAYQTWKNYFDLYAVDAKGRRMKRLTRGMRARDAAALPDPNKVVYISNEAERPTLGIFDLSTRETEILYSPRPDDDYIQLAEPTVSPDGKKIALSVWHNDGNRDIFLFDLEARAFERVTFDAERDITPAFSPDGRYLLFTSARTGFYNLFALDLVERTLFRVTNVFGGAFDPAVSPKGTHLAFANYGTEGFDIHLTAFDPGSWKPAPYLALEDKGFAPCKLGREIGDKAEDAKEEYKETDYSPWRTIWPRYWIPSVGIVDGHLSLGGTTTGHDVLAHHLYTLAAEYAARNDFTSFAAGYTNAILRPNFSVGVSRHGIFYGPALVEADGGTKDYWEERFTGYLAVTYPITSAHRFLLEYLAEDRSPLTEIPEDGRLVIEQGLFAGLRAGWFFDNSDFYRESISPSGGGSANITYTAFSEIFGADFEVRTLLGTYAKYFGMPYGAHVIAARATAGYAEGETLYLKAFRLGGFQNDQILARASENRVFLRGFDRSSLRGQRVAAGSLEYRMPLLNVERGISTWPIFLEDISLYAISDAGTAWEGMFDEEEDEILVSSGGELHTRFLIAYYYLVQLRFAGAYGFFEPERRGGFHWILTFGGSF
jgi:WD40 repeat protein